MYILSASMLVGMLSAPSGRSTGTPAPRALTTTVTDEPSGVTFVDIAKEAGLNAPNVWGGINKKKYIVEAKGSGLAFFDYDNDGWIDIYLTNGVRFEETYTPENAPIQHLYRNNRNGTFTDVTEKAGLARTGWGTGVSVGDYDNDGWDDLFCGYWGHNILWHNNGDGTFTDVTTKAGLWEERVRWGTGSTFLDYDRDGFLDLFVSNYIELDIKKVPAPGQAGYCQWKGIPVMCGPHGLPGRDEHPLPQQRKWHLHGRFAEGRHPEARPALLHHRRLLRFRQRRLARHLRRRGFRAQHPFPQQPRRHLYRHSVPWPAAPTTKTARSRPAWAWAWAITTATAGSTSSRPISTDDTPDLYRNNGDGTFTDVTFVSGLGVNTQYVCWGAGFMDYDNDGWTDIFHVTGHVYPEIESYHLDVAFSFATPRLPQSRKRQVQRRLERHGTGRERALLQPRMRVRGLRQRWRHRCR